MSNRLMKDSGVEWIGEIPAEWSITKGKYHFTNNKYVPGVNANQFDRLALTLRGVVSRSKEDADGLQPKDFSSYQLLRKNELVFKLIDLQNVSTSRVGLAHATGLVSPAYIVLHANNDMCPQYAEKFYLMMWHREIFNALGDNGVRSNLGASDLLNTPVVVPPIDVQRRIADFLDGKCAEIDELVGDIQEQIEVLEQYKKSVITEAVTKGLEPGVPMKDSGIEWVGEIPEYWDTITFKHIHCGSNVGESIDKEFWSRDIENRVFYTAGLNPIHTTFSYFPSWKYTRKNDLLLARNGTPYVYCPTTNALYSDHIIRVSILDKFDRRFVCYCLQRSIETVVVDVVSIATWSVGVWNKQKVPYPPIGEQKCIADYLDLKCAEIDAVIGAKREQVEVLGEYKKSLIYEYVTGKMEVPCE